MTEQELTLRYAPIVHFDQNETIPLQAVGYTIAKETTRSQSFPKREIVVPQDAAFVIEYAYYWDYDIQHMYDLEHIWVTVSGDGQVMDAEGSFHGKYLKLLLPELPGALLPTQGHVHAFCQPGKHAFMPNGQLFRLLPDWYAACTTACGGPVLIGGCFNGVYQSTAQEDACSIRYLRENLSFKPTLHFTKAAEDFGVSPRYMPWTELYAEIPQRIRRECDRLLKLYQTT